MKRVIILVLCLVFFIPLGYTEDTEDPAKYEVVLIVTYNALSISEATKIVSAAMKRHQNACRVKLNISKNGDDALFRTTIPTAQDKMLN
jgi:hypothetical protein